MSLGRGHKALLAGGVIRLSPLQARSHKGCRGGFAEQPDQLAGDAVFCHCVFVVASQINILCAEEKNAHSPDRARAKASR